MLSPARHFLLENCPLYYPFGNTRVRNVLADFNNRLGDEDNDAMTTKILFLGSGDLRNALKATTNDRRKGRNLHIHLNDYNASVVARNVMLLSIISAPEFNPDDKNDFAFLWDLWYNSEWPTTTRDRFKMVLKDLLDGRLRENIIIAKSKHLQILRETWSSWHVTSLRSLSASNLLMKKINKERNEFMLKGWIHKNKRASSTISQALDGIADELVGTVGSHVDLNNYSMKQKIFAEARLFMEKGNCRLQKAKAVCVNPTLLHPATLRWHVHYTLSPYCGYLPLSREEVDMTVRSQVLIRSCQRILRSLVSSYRRRLEDVKVFFHLEEALEYCYTERSLKFDVIDSSNIADYEGLVNVINACKLRLADHADAQFLTESMGWRHLTPLLYVEDMLCCPLSMIPTIYGLRLTSNFQARYPNLQRDELSTISLCWKNVPPLRNVVLYSSSTLTQCLIELANKCYLMHDIFSLAYFCTPQTFQYVINSAAERIAGGNSWLNDVRRQIFSKLPSVFDLSKRTTESWAAGRLVFKFTANVSFEVYAHNLKLLESRYMATPLPRLALIPLFYIDSGILFAGGDLLENIISFNWDVHFIDNLQVEMKRNYDDSVEYASISFLLIPDHGLEETHFGLVLDLGTRLPIFIIESIDNLRVEQFQMPYPFERKKSPSDPPSSTGEESEVLVADNCVETEREYSIKINIISRCKDPVSGLTVITDQWKPYRSAQELTVSISQPQNIRPLKISLPFPFIADSIQATLHRRDRFAVIVLQKALGAEPWPCEADLHREDSSLKENPLHFKRIVEARETDKREVGKEAGRCAACEKIPANLKRCSRCRAVNYCSVECQRAHWAQHKLACTSSGKTRSE